MSFSSDGYKGDIALTAAEYEREVTYYEEYKRNLRRLQEEEERANKTNKAERRTKLRRRHHHKTAGRLNATKFVLICLIELCQM